MNKLNNRGITLLVSIVLLMTFMLAGCTKKEMLNPKEPITLTLWHVFGGQTESPMNEFVEEFNATIGKNNGVVINVTSISNSSDIHDALITAARGHAGAGDLPDLFFCYPETAKSIGSDRLIGWNDHFTKEELRQYIPEFLEEGTIDANILVFPVAKSSEALFVNEIIFDRFAADTGVTYGQLSTWEELFEVAEKYYQWSDGKTFIMHDELLNFCQINTKALGGQAFIGDSLNFDDPTFREQWNIVAKAAISGHLRVEDNYETVCMMTGDIIAGIGSTASIMYFQDTVTFRDNTTEPLLIRSLPCPTPTGGTKMAMQQGTGLAASVKGNAKKEAAALLFAKWITEGEVNLRFVTQSGYMPVQNAAFNAIDNFNFIDDGYRSLYESMNLMRNEYHFYLPPIVDGYYELLWSFYENSLEILTDVRQRYEANEGTLEELIEISYDTMRQAMM